MAVPFLNSITLNKNEVQNFKVFNLGNDPTTGDLTTDDKGYFWLNTGVLKLRWWTGTATLDLLDTSSSISGSQISGNISGNAANVTSIVAVANGGTGTSTGSITGTGELTFTSGGANNNLNLNPTGTGTVVVGGSGYLQANITGTADKAVELSTSRTLWGQSFNGTANVTGDLSSVGNITGTAAISITTGGSNTSITLAPNGTGTVDVSSKKITHLATPVDSTDAANKSYVDSVAQGLDAKSSCYVATNGTSINLANPGTITIDSIPYTEFTVDETRILVKDQSTAAQNGIYIWHGDSSAMTRSPDANTWAELVGAYTFIEKGTVNAYSGYICSIPPTGTLGTTDITWTKFSQAGSYTQGRGMVLSGTAFNFAQNADYTPGQIPFASSETAIGFNANLHWDNSNNRLGIGTASPSYPLDVAGNARSNAWIGRSNGSAPTADCSVYRPADNSIAFSTANIERVRIDSSGNVGIGVVPNAWGTGYKAIQLSSQGVSIFGSTATSYAGFTSNGFYNGSNWAYNNSAPAGLYIINQNSHVWYNAVSGTAGATQSATSGQQYTVTTLGNTTLAQWQALFNGLTVLPTVGQTITATATDTLAGTATFTQIVSFSTLATLNSTGLGIGMSPNASQGKVQVNAALASTIDCGLRITDNATTSLLFNNTGSGASAIWSSGSLAFGTGNNTFSQKLVIDTSGNVSVGTASAFGTLTLQRYTSTPYTTLTIGDIATPANSVGIYGRVTSGDFTISTAGGAIRFSQDIGSTARMTIDTSGNVGIGIASPAAKLQVQGSATTNAFLRFGRYSGYSGGLEFRSYTGSGGWDIKTSTDADNANLVFSRNEGTGSYVFSDANVGIGAASPNYKLQVGGTYQSVGTSLVSLTESAHVYRGTPDGTGWEHAKVFSGRDASTYTYGSYIAFYTEGKNSGTSDTSTEKVRIDSSGNVGIGVTPSGWTSYGNIQGQNAFVWSSYAAAVGHNFYYDASGGGYRYITANDGASSYSPYNGEHTWYYKAPSTHAAGATIGFSQAMKLDTSGNLGIGKDVPITKIHVKGVAGTGTALRFEPSTSTTIYSQVKGNNGDLYLQADPGNVEASTNIIFEVDGANQAFLSSTGLGIGSTPDASTKLTVYDTNSVIRVNAANTGYAWTRYNNTSTNLFVGIDNSTGSQFGAGNYARIIWAQGAYPLVFATNDTARLTIASTGAATFAGDVTVNGTGYTKRGSSTFYKIPGIYSEQLTGTGSSFVINHALGSRDVSVTVRQYGSPYAVVITDVEMTDTNNVTVKFASSVNGTLYTVTVIG